MKLNKLIKSQQVAAAAFFSLWINTEPVFAGGFSLLPNAETTQQHCDCSKNAQIIKPQKPTNSVFFLGVKKQFNPVNVEGEKNLKYFAYAKNTEYQNWNIETGVGTFEDSYDKRSYLVFSNVSNDRFNTRYLQPTVSLSCAYKGYSHEHDDKKWYCAPPLKLRIGKEKGLFTYITPVPRINDDTHGFVAMEVGYRF